MYYQKTINSLIVIFILLISTPIKAQIQEVISDPTFGKITMYHPDEVPNSLVLFLSGDGGWQLGVINMGRYLAKQGALVAGIDAKVLMQNLGKIKSN